MDLQLSGKVALVTGASSGIGAAVGAILAEEGVDVVVSYLNDAEGAARVVERARMFGRRSWLCRMDVTQPGDVERAAQQVHAETGGLDILVLSAGYNVVTPLAEITPCEWDRVLAANLSGAFYVLQGMAPLLRDGGSIVTVASVAAHTGAPHHAHYAAAEAGLVNLTKSAARELAPRVRVNCVAPGITLTPMGQNTVDSLPEDYARQKLLAQRYASPEEIARCIVFVASPVAGFMTGATVDINGGRELR
jgi:NAD(P)-dependent dehydrogenase (short-subunit alcohol dehydrogenase family)